METVFTGLGISNLIQSDHECTWRGVTCGIDAANSTVTEIRLDNMQLSTTIPTEIGLLQNLIDFDVCEFK